MNIIMSKCTDKLVQLVLVAALKMSSLIQFVFNISVFDISQSRSRQAAPPSL